MLEVIKKQMVKTRKDHECYGCCDLINKYDAAVYVSGKEDGKYLRFHLHIDCHMDIMKRNLFAEGIKKGCLANKEALETFDIANTAYPF